MLRFASAALISTLIAAPAFASTPFTATLQTPKEDKERITAYDAIWVCEADTCEALLDRKTATVRVCKKVVSEIGPITSFGTDEDMLDDEEVAKCNASLD
jgi:hypothetical protein